MKYGVCKLRKLDNGKYTRLLGSDAWFTADARKTRNNRVIEAQALLHFDPAFKHVDALLIFERGCYVHDVKRSESFIVRDGSKVKALYLHHEILLRDYIEGDL